MAPHRYRWKALKFDCIQSHGLRRPLFLTRDLEKTATFDIGGVAPGSYALFASASTPNPNAPNPASLQALPVDQLQALIAQGINIGGAIPIGARIPSGDGKSEHRRGLREPAARGSLAGEFIFEGSLASSLTAQQKASFPRHLSRQPDIPGASLAAHPTEPSLQTPQIPPSACRASFPATSA
jgi:hypothetical protein